MRLRGKRKLIRRNINMIRHLFIVISLFVFSFHVLGEIHKVTFDIGSGICATTELEGSEIQLPEATPSVECQREGWAFAGWSETKITGDETDVNLVSNPYTPIKDCILYAVYSKREESVGEESIFWKLTDIANIESTDEVVITMINSSGTYALTNKEGTSGAPVATKVEVSNDALINVPFEDLIWNISSSSGVYNIYPNGSTENWLYCTDTNKGVCIGDSANKNFKIKDNYLQHIYTRRYLGVYNNQDWRCYTSTGANISGQTLGFYVKIIEFGTINTTIYNSVPDCEDIEEYIVMFGDAEIETVGGKISDIPALPESCHADYLIHVGWTENETFGVATEKPELVDENTIFTRDTKLYPVYSKVVEVKKEWLIVTDASSLAVNDEVIIVAKDYFFGLSTTQNNNNRGQTHVLKNESKDKIVLLSNLVQVLTLEAGIADGTFAFYTSSGYLYAASSKSNYLQTHETKEGNSSWKITIAEDSAATVVAQGENTRNTIQYNKELELFTCYLATSTSGDPIVLYKNTDVIVCEYYTCGDKVIESGESFNVSDAIGFSTLTIKSNCDEAGQVVVEDKNEIKAHKVIVEKTIDASRYYFFSLPFDCNIKDIVAKDLSATSLEYYDDYTIFYYDQKKASDNKGVSGSKAWVEITDINTTLNANQGYIIGYLVDEGTATIKFKSLIPQTISTPATTTLAIDDYIWYTQGEVETANGWNLIGMPYYQNVGGGLIPHLVTIPNHDGKTYTQTTFAEADIAPFTSFFVQVTEAPTFTIEGVQTAASMFDGYLEQVVQQKVVITLSDVNGNVDETTVINNPANTVDYEIGHDLVKWIGYSDILQIYSIEGDNKLAFNSRAIANSVVIPLGVYAHEDGEYRFSLNEKSEGDLQDWRLYDKEEDKVTGLANEDLIVYLKKGIYEERFELRLQQRVTTDRVNVLDSIVVWKEKGKLNIGNIPIDAKVYIYDILGRMVYMANATSTLLSYDFPFCGVYNIVVSSAKETIVYKIVY